MHEIKGDTYSERVISQTRLWLDGIPVHNHVDGECCSDFSCCNPEMYTDDFDQRKVIYNNTMISIIPRITNWYKYVIVPVV